MSDDSFEYKDFGLDKLVELLKGDEAPIIKVGILGDKNSRKDDSGNADVGRRHEYGIEGMPLRSFLRQPLIDNMQSFIEKTKTFDENTLKEMFKEKSGIEYWFKKVGAIAEDVVADAFETGGNGQWKPSNMKYKKVHQTLVESQQLRDSITFVVEKES